MMEFERPERHPAISLMLFLAFFVAGIFIAQFLVLVLLFPVLGKEVLTLGNMISHPDAYPDAQNIILFVQGFTSAFSMIVMPIIFMQKFYPGQVPLFNSKIEPIFYLTTGLLVIVSMPFNASIADYNQTMKFPEFLQDFEAWARDKENELKFLTVFLTNFQSDGQFLVGLLVIAIIPAIGEELIFRGLIQTHLLKWIKNPHIAIWLSAILFSAIHFQFYGFVPRMLLGALFGYVYVWTGTILIPITGHFINNGFTLFLIHMKNQSKINMDIETTKDMSVELIVGSAVLFVVLMYLFKLQLKSTSTPKTASHL